MAEEQPPKKIPRIRGQNFSSMEVNLISRRVVEELALLRGKFGKDVTADAKNKIWEKITAEVIALGVSYRQVLTVKTKFRNLTRDAKDKFTYEKRERNRTGGGPAPKPIRFPQQTETSESRPTQFSIQESSSSDPIYFAEPVSSPIPAQIAASGCQTSDGNYNLDFCIMLCKLFLQFCIS
ncbi:unnamed protein product [Mytilus coruscus]|uniref:Myb/SANT-like DNA-binding domain-containing protein n=1 Tax=Mytilus coruscus TaxID=42192 RepID=A0A6J8CTY1_MYTCO|nr:unnamed protein product [Mytilus coruscus]